MTDDSTERDLFRNTIGDVRPVKRSDRINHRSKPLPNPQHSRASEREVMAELLKEDPDARRVQTGEELSWLRPGYQRRVLKRLRRGHYAVHGEIDLHHMSQKEARKALAEFFVEAHDARATCVKIVHGKGKHLDAEPVLKNLVNGLLRRRRQVIAFTSAPPRDGGVGAVYVLLSPSHGGHA